MEGIEESNFFYSKFVIRRNDLYSYKLFQRPWVRTLTEASIFIFSFGLIQKNQKFKALIFFIILKNDFL